MHNLETRKSQILENIEAAEKQREDSERSLKSMKKLFPKANLKQKLSSIKLEKKL